MEFERAKVIVGGDSGVGKTALVHLICNQQTLLHPSYTIGCSVDIKVHLYNNNDSTKEHPYFIELWDIGGSNSHENTRSIFYQNLHGLILVYDCTNKKSQLNLRKWLCDILGKQVLKKSEPDIDGGVVAGATAVSGATTISTGNNGSSFGCGGSVKVNMPCKITSLLPMSNTENVVNRLFTPPESQTNNNTNNLNHITNTIYPPILVVGTKLDLLAPRSLHSLQRVTSRFNSSTPYIHHESTNDKSPCISMTPRSCVSSVHIFEDTLSTSTSQSWNSSYHQPIHRKYNGCDDDDECRPTTSTMLQSSLSPKQQRHQSVYIDLSDSRLLSNSSTKDKEWNFATEQGFSEILLNCNSIASISPGSSQDLMLNRFFDEVVNYKMLTMSMNCNLSPDLSRIKRRPVDPRNNSTSLFNSYKYN
uniref:RAB, member of RAS oncogene family-like 3 n=1 Tax=Schistosoma japonicum TaxID=6182 RepID=C1LGM5_SCHJA|nr:RAB, member of RAS oncogene family-like 3 [Schistosoma japonicum]